MSARASTDPAEALLDQIEAQLRQRQLSEAEQCSRAFVAQHPTRHEGYVLLGRALQKQGQLRLALDASIAARTRAPTHPAPELLRIECLLQLGENATALDALRQLTALAHGHSRLLQDVAQLYSHVNCYAEAEACYARAAMLSPDDPVNLYNWSTAL